MPPQYPNFVIDKLSTDEEITLFLATRRIPHLDLANAIRGQDPLSIEPPNSSGEWYLYKSEASQYTSRGSAITETESGFWKTKEDCRIFTTTNYVGRKTTMEFYNGKVPNGNRTRWIMHKYQTEEKTSNGLYNENDYNIALYRVFLQNHRRDYEEHYSSANYERAMELRLSILQELRKNISPSRDVLNRSLGQSASSGSLYEILHKNAMNNINATWELSGDFLEPNDIGSSVACQSLDPEIQEELYPHGDFLELNDITRTVACQSVDPEIQGELYPDGDFLELKDITSPVISSNSMDEEGQPPCSDKQYLEQNDLCSSATYSSSSDNSSRMPITDSSDYFYSGSARSNTSIAVEESAPASLLPALKKVAKIAKKKRMHEPVFRGPKKGAKIAKKTKMHLVFRGLQKVAKIAKKKYCCFGPF